MDRTSQAGLINHNYIQNYTSSKALTTGNYAKSLTADGQAETATEWVETNRHYYDEIMNGVSTLSQEDQDLFMQWWNWCMSQPELQGMSSSYGDDFTGSSDAGVPSTQPSLPAGATYGAQGNIVFDQMDATINYAASSQPIDIFSNNIEINSSSMMTTFTSEITTDSRTQKPDGTYDQVLKITSSDGTVYFIHDFEDANVTIRTPVQNMIDGGAPSQSNMTWEEYSATAAADDVPATEPSYSGGDVEQTDDNTWVHTGKVGEPILFNPNPTPVDGISEVHDIYGDATITLRADMSALITYDSPSDTHKITVKDRDGNVIAEYILHPGNKTNLNANANQVTVDRNTNDSDPAEKIADYDGTGSFWEEDFSFNGEQGNKVADGVEKPKEEKPDVPGYLEDFAKAFSPDLSDDDIAYLMDPKHKDLLDEIHYGGDFPSKDLLEFMKKHDDALKLYCKNDDEDKAANRIGELLIAARGFSVGNNDKNNNVIGINGTDWKFTIDKDGDLHWEKDK